MRLCVFVAALACVSATPAHLPFPGTHDPAPYNSSIRPLVLWHGLGDSYKSVGMLEFADLIRGVHPGIYVHNIWVNEDMEKDQKAGFVSSPSLLYELSAHKADCTTVWKRGAAASSCDAAARGHSRAFGRV